MSKRDDMVIVPRLKRREEQGVKQRAAEERRMTRERRKRRRLLRHMARRWGALRAMRQAAGKPFRKAKTKAGKSARRTQVLRGASRAMGLAFVLAEGVILAGQAVRKIEHGKSSRLIQAEDAHTIYGDMDEQLTASASVRSFYEGRPDVLRAMGNQGRMNAGLQSAAADLEKLQMQYLRGADLIERDPFFDSPDSFTDKLLKLVIARARAAGIAEVMSEAMRIYRKYVLFSGWK
jgi:hypothetical protein